MPERWCRWKAWRSLPCIITFRHQFECVHRRRQRTSDSSRRCGPHCPKHELCTNYPVSTPELDTFHSAESERINITCKHIPNTNIFPINHALDPDPCLTPFTCHICVIMFEAEITSEGSGCIVCQRCQNSYEPGTQLQYMSNINHAQPGRHLCPFRRTKDRRNRPLRAGAIVRRRVAGGIRRGEPYLCDFFIVFFG